MTETAKPEATSRLPFWLWPIVVPALPVLCAIPLLQYFGTPGDPAALAALTLAQDGVAALRHAGDRVVYIASVVIHTGVCLAAVAYYCMVLHRIAGKDLLPILLAAVLAIAAMLFAMVQLAEWEPPLAIYRVTFFSFETLLKASSLSRDLTVPAQPGSLPPLAQAVLFASALGIVSVIMAASVISAVLRRIGAPHANGWAAAFRANVRIVFRCFYALSAVLVTSTVSALLFFQLPTGLATRAGNAAISGYAAGVATFWGAIYTMTLFATFAGPIAALYSRARRHVDDHALGQDLFEWLKENGLDSSVGENIKNLIVVLAPLLVGPLGELTRAVGG